MPRRDLPKGISKSPSARHRWRLLGAATASIVILSTTWGVALGNAEGPLYTLPPPQPPPQESINFTNHLNHRVPNLPATLNPPVAESPEQVEARTRVLEQGVVIPGGGKPEGAKKFGADPRTPSVATGAKRGTDSQESVAAATAPGPLSVSFVGAGVLALLGLLLGAARGWRPGRARRARPQA
jgi:hypothetical protein